MSAHEYPGGQFVPICRRCGCDGILAANGVPTCEEFEAIRHPGNTVCPCGKRGEGTTHGGSSCTSSAVVERKLRP